MKKAVVIATAVLLLVSAHSAFGEIRRQTLSINSGSTNIQAQVEETRVSSGEWLKENDKYRFRTTNGQSLDVTVDLSRSSFTNCRVTASRVFAPSNGSWSTNFIQVEVIDRDSPWSYDLVWSYEWR